MNTSQVILDIAAGVYNTNVIVQFCEDNLNLSVDLALQQSIIHDDQILFPYLLRRASRADKICCLVQASNLDKKWFLDRIKRNYEIDLDNLKNLAFVASSSINIIKWWENHYGEMMRKDLELNGAHWLKNAILFGSDQVIQWVKNNITKPQMMTAYVSTLLTVICNDGHHKYSSIIEAIPDELRNAEPIIGCYALAILTGDVSYQLDHEEFARLSNTELWEIVPSKYQCEFLIPNYMPRIKTITEMNRFLDYNSNCPDKLETVAQKIVRSSVYLDEPVCALLIEKFGFRVEDHDLIFLVQAFLTCCKTSLPSVIQLQLNYPNCNFHDFISQGIRIACLNGSWEVAGFLISRGIPQDCEEVVRIFSEYFVPVDEKRIDEIIQTIKINSTNEQE